jgi:hypothetical protein
MKMEQTECSEMQAYQLQMLMNHPEEGIQVQKALEINHFYDKFLTVLLLGTVHHQGKRNLVTKSSSKTVGTFAMYLKAQTVRQCNIFLVFPNNERCPTQVLPR